MTLAQERFVTSWRKWRTAQSISIFGICTYVRYAGEPVKIGGGLLRGMVRYD